MSPAGAGGESGSRETIREKPKSKNAIHFVYVLGGIKDLLPVAHWREPAASMAHPA